MEPCTAGPLITLLTLKSALPLTIKVADAAVLLLPTDVVKDPAAMVLVKVPEVELVTTTVTVQDELGGMTEPAAKVTALCPIVAVAVPGLQLVKALEEKLTSPAGVTGYASINAEDNVAPTKACVLVIVIVNRAVPPAAILAGKKLLEINGREGVTESTSETEQTPPVHPDATLVFVTLLGGEITAVLVTCVCPIATDTPNPSRQTKAARDITYNRKTQRYFKVVWRARIHYRDP